jgi:uncharacterized membrane protein YeiH
MTISELSDAVQYSMDLIGIFAFALSGAFLAVHKDFNIFGTFLLAEAAGLGGELFRDLVIGVTPVAFTDTGYYLAPFVATLIIFFTARPTAVTRCSAHTTSATRPRWDSSASPGRSKRSAMA